MVRTALPGDYFLIASPEGDELRRVLELQREVAEAVGGQIVDDIHLTLQRFEIANPSMEDATVDAIAGAVADQKPPDVIASRLFTSLHRYFNRNSIRWDIESTQDLGRLTLLTAQAIMHVGGKSHWPNADAPIAQFMTAVWTDAEAVIPDPVLKTYPKRIMGVSRLIVTCLEEQGTFRTVREIRIGH